MITDERTTITGGASFENSGTRAWLQALVAAVSPSSPLSEQGMHASRLAQQQQASGVRII